MRSTLVGTAVALLVGLAGAAAASAQVEINPNGPTCVESDDTTSTYTAVVTTDYDFDLNLKVYLNSTLKYDNTTFVVNDGPSYNYREDVDHTGWGMRSGDTLHYRAKATLTEGPYQGSYATASWYVTVSDPGHCFLDRRRQETGAWA